MFGKKFGDEKIEGVPVTIAVQRLLLDIIQETLSPLHLIFGTKFVHANLLAKHRKLNREIVNMRKFGKRMIEEEINVEKNSENFLKLLLDQRSAPNSEGGMTDEHIISEFIGFFAAGTDTTAHLVASAIFFLWKYPLAFVKVKEEVDKEFAELNKVDIENLNRMNYTTAFLKETLRLGGPASSLIDRVATRDDDICGLKIKRGTFVNINISVLLTSDKYFSRPQEFLPERWLGDPEFENDGYKKEAYAFIPFSAGPRNCIGQHLAMIESRILMALFIKTFDFSFPKDYEFRLVQRFVQETLDPLTIIMKPK